MRQWERERARRASLSHSLRLKTQVLGGGPNDTKKRTATRTCAMEWQRPYFGARRRARRRAGAAWQSVWTVTAVSFISLRMKALGCNKGYH